MVVHCQAVALAGAPGGSAPANRARPAPKQATPKASTHPTRRAAAPSDFAEGKRAEAKRTTRIASASRSNATETRMMPSSGVWLCWMSAIIRRVSAVIAT